ncbi:MAG TPA: hypothetical protein VFN22_03905 [Gemmatimonadales bacterium]|nr:hypothetical protein [Gemmatimonadales bacterium]
MATRPRSLIVAAAALMVGCAPAPAPGDAPDDSAVVVTTAPSDTTFRAHGQEPGWVVAVFGRDSITFVLDYGDLRFTTPAEAPLLEGDTTMWHATQDTLEVDLRAVRTLCTDAMRGDSFPARVSLTVGARTFDGCGRWPTETAP